MVCFHWGGVGGPASESADSDSELPALPPKSESVQAPGAVHHPISMNFDGGSNWIHEQTASPKVSPWLWYAIFAASALCSPSPPPDLGRRVPGRAEPPSQEPRPATQARAVRRRDPGRSAGPGGHSSHGWLLSHADPPSRLGSESATRAARSGANGGRVGGRLAPSSRDLPSHSSTPVALPPPAALAC